MHRLVSAAFAAGLAMASLEFGAARAQALTLDQALALARERASAIRAAGERVEEARARLAGASALLRENPVVSGALGARDSDDGDTTDYAIGASQTFEIAGQRGVRVAAAEADVARAGAVSEDAARRLLREVSLAFCNLLHAQSSLALASDTEQLASELARIAERRHRAEDVPVLDANLSRAALARARSERLVAEASLADARGALRIQLGMDAGEPVVAEGELRTGRFDRGELAARAGARADLRASSAQLEQAEAQRRLARRELWPDVDLGARYERDDRDDVVLGELSVPIPVFDRGQGRRAESDARVRRLRLELDAARRTAAVELDTALAAYEQRLAAVEELEASALPLLDANESLARRSYEAGEMGLGELLLVRRETLETRRAHLERLREAAFAAIDVRAAAGALE